MQSEWISWCKLAQLCRLLHWHQPCCQVGPFGLSCKSYLFLEFYLNSSFILILPFLFFLQSSARFHVSTEADASAGMSAGVRQTPQGSFATYQYQFQQGQVLTVTRTPAILDPAPTQCTHFHCPISKVTTGLAHDDKNDLRYKTLRDLILEDVHIINIECITYNQVSNFIRGTVFIWTSTFLESSQGPDLACGPHVDNHHHIPFDLGLFHIFPRFSRIVPKFFFLCYCWFCIGWCWNPGPIKHLQRFMFLGKE